MAGKGINRRRFGWGAAAGLLLPGVARAATCAQTPRQGEGPFFPVTIGETDWDLTRLQGRSARAEGKIIEVRGTITDESCRPLAGAAIELWQANHHGRYDHPGDSGNPRPLDENFQGYATLTAGAAGEFRFRTIKPGAYPASGSWWRPPHIHFKAAAAEAHPLTTQMYFAGEELNDQDFLVGRLQPAARAALEVAFDDRAADNVPVGTFNLVLKRS